MTVVEPHFQMSVVDLLSVTGSTQRGPTQSVPLVCGVVASSAPGKPQ